MLNLLTFDVEEWFQANYPSTASTSKVEVDERLEVNVRGLLDLCAEHQARATFFILGRTAERHPRLVPLIQEKGHEIASHGYEHILVYEQTPESFGADLRKSLDVLGGISRQSVLGYRAPSWSVNTRLPWFYDILESYGLAYDSSLFPARTFLYGDNRARRFPHCIGNLIEIPASTVSLFGLRIPFASGFFFRLFPGFIIRFGIRALNRRGQPAMICLHPREIDVCSPKLKLPRKERFIHYVNIKTARNKLAGLLASFSFCSIQDYLSLEAYRNL
jgi:polysaccharide deacetylase family protein (PEP-CTERM system associated)